MIWKRYKEQKIKMRELIKKEIRKHEAKKKLFKKLNKIREGIKELWKNMRKISGKEVKKKRD